MLENVRPGDTVETALFRVPNHRSPRLRYCGICTARGRPLSLTGAWLPDGLCGWPHPWELGVQGCGQFVGMMLSFYPCQSSAMTKGIKSFCIIWPKMRQAGSGLVPLAYHFRPDLDPLLILQRQAKVVALVEPTLMVSGAAALESLAKSFLAARRLRRWAVSRIATSSRDRDGSGKCAFIKRKLVIADTFED
jgi:hypothetical protein